MTLRWVPGPSRTNERTFTRKLLAHSVEGCRDRRLPVDNVVGRVAWALSCVQALHVDATEWPEFRSADRCWWALNETLLGPSTSSGVRATRDQLQAALRATL